MKTKNFEEKLIHMSKPEITELQHQDMLARSILKSKDKSVLSGWWLSIPLYIIAALIMKAFFMQGTTMQSNLHNLINKEKYSSFFFFLGLPIVFIIINTMSIRKIYYLSGNPQLLNFLRLVWFNLLVIIISILILIIYSL
jgi:hypothetical protein